MDFIFRRASNEQNTEDKTQRLCIYMNRVKLSELICLYISCHINLKIIDLTFGKNTQTCFKLKMVL